jgi:hypothetical protein
VLVEHLQGLKKKRELWGFLACLMYGRGLTATFDGAATPRLKELCRHVRVNYAAIERKVKADARKKTAGKAKPGAANKPPKRAQSKVRRPAKPAAKVRALKVRRSAERTLPAAA